MVHNKNSITSSFLLSPLLFLLVVDLEAHYRYWSISMVMVSQDEFLCGPLQDVESNCYFSLKLQKDIKLSMTV